MYQSRSLSLTLCLLAPLSITLVGCQAPQGLPEVTVRQASPLQFPGVPTKENPTGVGHVDCNSPSHWDGSTLYMFFSTGHPWRSQGPDLFHLSVPSVKTTFDNEQAWNQSQQGPRWSEATYKAPDGKLYMWYHNEPHPCCGKEHWTAPRIGAMVSEDNGLNFKDLGLILEAPAGSLACDTPNKYFTGGNGDFCVNVDRQRQYVYFFISTYNKDKAEQGVSVARMRFADLDRPVARVWKWYNGKWAEPGLGGHVSPIFPGDWHRKDADAFWGPSIHWNHYLNTWVMLLNRALDSDWNPEGIYISFNSDLGDPAGWSPARKILDKSALGRKLWYPQVVGMDAKKQETDKLAGKVARLFFAGVSEWEIEFHRPGELRPSKP